MREESYATLISNAIRAGESKRADALIQEAISERGKIIYRNINKDIHHEDRPFLLAVMKMSIKPLESAVGASGRTLCETILRHTATFLVPVSGGDET